MSKGNKIKNKQWDLIKLKAFVQQRKPSIKQKRNLPNRRNICKLYDQ